MKVTERPLQEGEAGPYGDLADRSLPDGMALVFMPSLAALLDQAEQLLGAPLTEQQVVRVRDAALVVVTLAESAEAVEQSRGYPDVAPARPWESWQAMRGKAG